MGKFMSLAIILCIFSVSLISAYSLTQLNTDGFTTDLIHRDSLISPLRNSTAIRLDRIISALRRSKNRADYYTFGSFISPELISAGGDFLMKLKLGTPPVPIIGIADTSSILSWTQCAPCDNCFPQKLPLFAPKSSSTYKTVPGNSILCKSHGGRPSLVDKTCRYAVSYLDSSYSHGIVSTDTLSVDSTVSHKNFVFGCGYENLGNFKKESTGVIGLGRGASSLITQMNSVVGGKFSYCLLPHEQSIKRPSTMHFGNRAAVTGSGVVSTGLHFFKNSYAAKLKGLSVGKKKLMTMNMTNSSKIMGFFNQRILIDSGTMLTHLPKKMYDAMEAEMKKEIKMERANPVETMRLCYKTGDGKMRGPIVTVHFVGADVKLYPVNTFVKVSENVHCLGFVAHDGAAILGNLAQINFLVGYDIKKMRVAFKQTDCSKQ